MDFILDLTLTNVTLINVIALKKQVILPERTSGSVENCKHYKQRLPI